MDKQRGFYPDRINGGYRHYRHPQRDRHPCLPKTTYAKPPSPICCKPLCPYRTAIELCALDHGGLTSCDGGSNGIPSPSTTRYVSAMSVARGVVTLTGQESLNGPGRHP